MFIISPCHAKKRSRAREGERNTKGTESEKEQRRETEMVGGLF
jgi:hypothetical protein